MTNLRSRIAGVLAVFTAGLLVSAYLRLVHLGSVDPPALASFATEIYIGITVFAAIVLRGLGAPLRRLGFHATPGPLKVLLLAAVSVALIQATAYLLEPLFERLPSRMARATRSALWRCTSPANAS